MSKPAMSDRGRAGATGRRLGIAGLMVLGVTAIAAPAQATVTQQATDPATGFAFSMTDDRNDADPANDVVIGLCMDNSGNCVETPRPDPLSPVSVNPDNFTPDGEGFYNLADATLPGLGIGLVRLGQEVAFLTDPPWVPGEGTSFYRARFRLTAGLKPNTWYQITHPLGVNEFQSDGSAIINSTIDVLDGQMPGFLQWGDGAPAGYIGDYAVGHTVIGSPFGTNFVQVDELPGGPNTEPPLGAQPISFTDQFNVQGKLAGAAPAPAPNAGLSKTSLAFGTRGVGTTSSVQTLTLKNNGTAPLTVTTATIGGTDPGDFAKASNTCDGASLPVGASCSVGVTFKPTAAGDRGATLTIADNAPGAPHNVALSGIGVASTVSPGPGAGSGAGGAAGSSSTTAATATAPAAAATETGASTATAGLRPALTIGRLMMATRVKRSAARRKGIRIVMDLADGTKVVKINIYRKTGGRLKLISSGFRTPSKTGRFAVNRNHAALRRLLRVGSYEVQVTPGRSRTDLGKTSRLAFKVV